jgi:release factor glutamine methyltransferase
MKMFVQTNTVKAIKDYFFKKLSDHFSPSEIKMIANESIKKRLELSPSEMMLAGDQLLSESDLLYFRSVIKRLLSNEPFQYILGETHFYGLDLNCDPRALIPRPETEELVDWVVKTYDKGSTPKILDLCTGSACIALGVKSKLIHAEVFASDLSMEAVDLATENAIKTQLEIQLLKFDALKPESYPFGNSIEFDCWISNPPYIPGAEKKRMDGNVLEHEPHMALFVDDLDPLVFYREIAIQAKKYLRNEGLLFFEIHELLARETVGLLEDLNFVNIELRKDLQGKNRMLKAQKG